jgi:hypothetical protein
MNKKNAIAQASLTMLVVLSIIIAAGANVLISTLTDRLGLRLDMTSAGLYHISNESLELMQTVNSRVSLYCVSESRDAVKEFSELLDKYDRASEQIDVVYIDPYANSTYLDNLASEGYEVGLNTVIVECGEKRRAIRMADMYQFNTDGSELMYFNGESMLTSAIISVSSNTASKTGVVMGHGEQVPTALQGLMVRNNHELIGVVLNQPVSEDITTLLAYAPQGDYSISELAQLDTFFARGGSLMLFSDPAVPELPNLDAFLSEWGIEFGKNIIFDAVSNLEANPANLIGMYTEHEITSYFQSRQYYTVLPAARSIANRFDDTNGRVLEDVMATSDTAYARKVPTRQHSVERLPEDESGPFMVAATSTMDYGAGSTGRIFAIGSKRVASDEMLQSSSAGNARFIARALEWCAGSNGTTVAIAPKQVGMSELAVPTGTAYALGAVFVVFLPLAGLVCGLRVFLKRRHL